MKRMVLSYNGDMMKIANPGGTVTVADDKGNAMIFEGNIAVRTAHDPRTCKHEHIYMIYNQPDGKEWYCQDCGCTVDEDGEIVLRGEPEF